MEYLFILCQPPLSHCHVLRADGNALKSHMLERPEDILTSAGGREGKDAHLKGQCVDM